MHTGQRSAVLLVTLALLFMATHAHAETISCTAITTLPYMITVQGISCFTGNLNTAMTSGNAIDIQTNNVVLDLNGFKLGELAAGLGTQAIGIHALNRRNITMKNGTIRGFYEGLLSEDAGASQGHVVEDIRADQDTWIGIAVDGANTVVRNDQVVAIGGSTFFGSNADAIGINVKGVGPQVVNNAVRKIVKQGSGQGWGMRFDMVSVMGLAVSNRITDANIGIEYADHQDDRNVGENIPSRASVRGEVLTGGLVTHDVPSHGNGYNENKVV